MRIRVDGQRLSRPEGILSWVKRNGNVPIFSRNVTTLGMPIDPARYREGRIRWSESGQIHILVESGNVEGELADRPKDLEKFEVPVNFALASFEEGLGGDESVLEESVDADIRSAGREGDGDAEVGPGDFSQSQNEAGEGSLWVIEREQVRREDAKTETAGLTAWSWESTRRRPSEVRNSETRMAAQITSDSSDRPSMLVASFAGVGSGGYDDEMMGRVVGGTTSKMK